MTTEYSPRLFAGDHDIRALGEGLLACSLPRAAWTHEAHLAACLWLLTERPDIDVDARIASLICAFNESVGGVNDDTQGYHDRSEEHTSELQSLMRISYAVFCLKKKQQKHNEITNKTI